MPPCFRAFVLTMPNSAGWAAWGRRDLQCGKGRLERQGGMWAGRRKLPCPGAPRGVRHPPMEKRSRKRLGPTASTRAFSAVWAFRGRCSWSANIRETCCTLCHIPRPRCLCVALRCCRRSCSYPCDAYSNLSRLCGMHLACQVRSLRGVPRPLRPTAQKVFLAVCGGGSPKVVGSAIELGFALPRCCGWAVLGLH